MPFITAKVSTPLTKEQEIEIKTKLGQAIELVPGKSEEYLLLKFEDNCRLWLRGKSIREGSAIHPQPWNSVPPGLSDPVR